MQKLVSIIIPTYNRCQEVLDCLESLSGISYGNVEIIVVDNASTDDTVRAVGEKFPNVRVVQLPENRGAVGGRNEGIKHAKGDYLCFVDSDNIVDKNFLTELVNLAESDKKIGFVGPKMYYYKEPNLIWFAGVKINFLTSRTTYVGINEVDRGQYDKVKEIDQIPNVWLVKREVIDKIGGLDPIYVMSYGEADWPVRAHRAGYKIMYCPKSVVYHNIEVPENRKTSENILIRGSEYRIYYLSRNRILFMKRFAPKLNFVVFLLFFNNIFLLLHCLIFIKYKRTDLIKVYLRGYFDGLKEMAKFR